MSQQDTDVLDGGDQVILDLLSPETSPTRALEVLVVGRIRKTALHQMLPSFAISPGGGAMGLGECYIQGSLFFMPTKHSLLTFPRALGPQETIGTHFL